MKRFLAAGTFAPFGESLFLALWIGAFISNIGTWIGHQNSFSLNKSPFRINSFVGIGIALLKKNRK